jgi:streptomycin 6-kinase
MVDIPEYYRRKAARQFGEVGPGWVQKLPSVLSHCLARWDLSECRPIEDLSINLVCYARSPTYGDVVLKIQGPHSERFTEMTALALYDGRRACRCLECDRERGAMLLERVLPGNDLRSVPAREEQLRIGTEMLCALPIPLRKTYGLPSYRDWMTNAFATVRRDYGPDSLMEELMRAAWELFHEVDDGGQFLLHGDLHHENMLRARSGEWKVIDPQGVVGPPVLECGRFIQNHVISDAGLDREKALHAISHIGAHMQQPERRVATAFFVLHLLSMCWGYEMNFTRQRLTRGIRECAELLSIVEGY